MNLLRRRMGYGSTCSRRTACIIWWLISLGTTTAVKAQSIRLAFDRQNNFTYATRLDMLHTYEQGPYTLQLQFQHRNLLNTNIPQQPFVQAYLNSRIWQFWALHPTLSAANWLESDQFWTGQNLRYNAYLGAKWQPNELLTIIPLIGYSWDVRRGILDQGWSPALRLSYRYRWPEGVQMETYLFARVRFIDPRRQHNLQIRSDWVSEVTPEAAIGFGVEVGSNQMDDYKSKSIERIQSDTLGGYVALQYQFTPKLSWESDSRVRLSQRQFSFRPFSQLASEFNDQSYQQSDFQTTQRFSWDQHPFQGMFTHSFERLNRVYAIENSLEEPDLVYERLVNRERQKDFSRQSTYMELLLQRPIRQRHLLAISGTNQYVRYDTPAEDNFDDHDELTYGLRVKWTAGWTRRFRTTYSVWGGVRRYAFLFSERSQDNYTQRNLRLDFGYEWNPTTKLTIKGEQSIYVTYNVKDFADRNLTDRATRNLETRISITARLSNRWRTEAQLYRKEVHVSYLNWAQFAETPLDTNTTYRVDWLNHYLPKQKWLQRRWRLSVGYRHFSQLRYLNTSMISLTNLLTPINLHIRTHQSGPLTALRINGKRGTEVDATIWWQWQLQNFKYGEAARFTTLSASYREERLQLAEQAFRPFIKLRVGVWL